MAKGYLVTMQIFALTLLMSLPLGFALALANLSPFKPLVAFVRGYILILRGTPLVLQVMFVYYGVPLMLIGLRKSGVEVPFDFKPGALTAAVTAFVLNYSAYFAEILRGGILSVDNGQYEAAFALGLSKRRTMFSIILPQTLMTSLPSLSNETISLVKDTALVSIITAEDLMRSTRLIVMRDVRIVPFAVAALFYLATIAVLTGVFKLLEKKFAYIK